MSDVTRDRLRSGELTLLQPERGYRFSVDAPLLACFAAAGGEVAGTVADLGAGCGVVGLLLCRKCPDALLTAVENNSHMADCARRNVEMNGLAGRVKIIEEDILEFRRISPPSSFDLVVSNPPFRASASGRISPVAGRDAARHESTATLADFLAAAKYLVRPGGRICFIYHPSRLPEFLARAYAIKLAVVRVRMIHGRSQLPASMFLAEMAKGSRRLPVVEPPLIVRRDDGSYTDEVAGMTGERL